MGTINLLELKPTRISRNLRGKYMLFYGLPKIGKTTLLTKFPKSLILEFETGTNALNNAYVQPISKWTEAKAVLRELRKGKRPKYDFLMTLISYISLPARLDNSDFVE